MISKKNMKMLNKISYYTGIVIVGGTHILILINGLPQDRIMAHAILNLVGVGFYAYSWFTK